MAEPELPQERYGAGREYLDQLRSLGLKPEGFWWVWDFEDQQFLLWMVWSGIDRFGPLEISKLLFRAYNSSLLTQKIDPFIVMVQSPDVQASAAMIKVLSEPSTTAMRLRYARFGETAPPGEDARYQVNRAWLYVLEAKRRKTLDLNRDWRRFQANIEKLAA